jgi:hypothetical protein
MVLIDYEDVSTLRDIRGDSLPYGYPTRVSNQIFVFFLLERKKFYSRISHHNIIIIRL